jgi:phage terminase small subunit
MTIKQRMFLKEYFGCGNATKAALKVYDTDNYGSAAVIAHQTLHSKKVMDFLKGAFEDSGLTDKRIVESLAMIIEAGTSEESLSKTTPEDALRALSLSMALKGY